MYKNKVFSIIFHPLIAGSTVLIVGGLFGNLFNFLFNLLMSRNLSVVEYGTLASLLSLIALTSMPAGSITQTLVRFAASYFSNNDIGSVKSIFIKINKLLFISAFSLLILFVAFSSQIGTFFNIQDNVLIILAGINVFAGIITITNMSILQARLEFKFITFLTIVGSFLKLSIGTLFVFLGFSVGGVMNAYFISILIPYFCSFLPLQYLFDKHIKNMPIQLNNFATYGVPATITLFSLSSFITTDILLVKHFFPQNIAGLYAGLSLIGRVIFFVSAPIVTVMFPMIVQRHTRKEKVLNLFLFSLFMVSIPSFILTIIYYLFPDFVIKFFLKREEYLAISGFLGYFGLFITSYSLLALVTNFYLSIKKIGVCVPLAIGALLQIILIWFFHENFSQIITISFSICMLLFSGLFVYYFVMYERKKKY